LIRYSKNAGMGYPWFFGVAEEGSEIFLSINGCLPVIGLEGFPVAVICRVANVAVEVIFILDIGSN
jgi:hypothetical protein